MLCYNFDRYFFLNVCIPIVILLHRWESNRFPSEQYGKVVWDTHIYTWSQHNHKPVEDLEELLSYYNKALMKIQKFQKDQNTSVLVGEFTLANLELVSINSFCSLF